MSDLLDLALDGHGGLELWEKLESVSATITVSGALFGLKGYPDGLGTTEVRADVSTPRVGFAPFLGNARGVFEPDRVVISAEDGSERHLDDPRAACLSVAPADPWGDLHLLYFAGYAMWNYLATPFMFTWPGFAVEEVEPWTEDAESWRRLRVTFPPDVPTHTPEQVFYFDEGGLLRRLDYAVDILGSPPPAAHYCDRHKEFSGLTVPTRRRVYLREPDGTANTETTFVEIEVADVAVA
jgi:hypothetical protein